MRIRRLCRDRRGAGMMEYAIILFVILVLAAVVFKLVGGRVKGVGSAATAQFEGSGAGDNGAGGSGGGALGDRGDKARGDKGAGGGQTAAAGDQGQGQGDQAGGAGGAAARGGKAGTGTGATGDGSAPIQPDEDEHRPPYMKIMAGVLVLFFAIAAYFVFRKAKKGG